MKHLNHIRPLSDVILLAELVLNRLNGRLQRLKKHFNFSKIDKSKIMRFLAFSHFMI